MAETVISIESISKEYQLGLIDTGSFRGDLQRWWAKKRGLPDPHLKIGEKDHGNRDGEALWALKDVSFDVKQGEAVGIIGRNGAGKSTLLKILSRVTAPTSGEVKVKGRMASMLEVGTGFHPELTGRENIYMNGAIMGMNKAEVSRKFDEIVDFSGVEQFINTPVKRYSSGMYVRLAFAVAAHLEPEILIVDEVLAVGDSEFQKKCLGKMGDVAHEGHTVVFVSHNMAAIENLCDKGIVLDRGTVAYIGSQQEAITHYMKSFQNINISLRDQIRAGSGLIRIVRIEFQDDRGHILQSVRSGQNVDIYIHYEVAKYDKDMRVHIGLSVSTQLGIVVFSNSSRLNGTEFRDIPQYGAFVCHIHRLPLPPSTYNLGVQIKADEVVADFIDDTYEMTVIEGDFYGSGKTSSIHSGVCLVDGKWQLSTK